MDEADLASITEEQNLHRAQTARQLQARKAAIHPTGQCHNCDDPLNATQLFCDSQCRDDWDRRRSRTA